MQSAYMENCANGQLEHAYLHTAAAWFPVNPVVLASIQKKLKAGYYDARRESLLIDLRSDLSLYLFCIKELNRILVAAGTHKMAQDAANSGASDGDVLGIPLDHNVFAILESVLNTSVQQISAHRIDEISDFQAMRLRDSMFSASTAEALAGSLGVDSQTGFACALFRQLGLTLVAWNYPTVYRHALETIAGAKNEAEADLDLVLHTLLGFSPAMLGVRFAQSWGMSDTVVAVVANRGIAGDATQQIKKGQSEADAAGVLAQICAVGEAFARANNPEHYPRARDDWKKAESAIKSFLGANGVTQIYQQAQKICSSYADVAPEVMRIESPVELDRLQGAAQRAQALYAQNIHLKACSVEVRGRIAGLYEQMEEKAKLDQQLQNLVRNVIPALGFDVCAVFTIDLVTSTLRPVLKLGTPSFVKLKACNVADVCGQLNPITEAFRDCGIVSENGMLKDGKQKLFFAAALGERNRVGVLYLEMPMKGTDKLKKARTVFRAVRQCLVDLLRLE